MTAKAEPTSATDTIEHLDFTPKCETQLLVRMPAYLSVYQCQAPAVWMATKPCCGHQSLICQEHRDGARKHVCAGCHAVFDDTSTWEWVRI